MAMIKFKLKICLLFLITWSLSGCLWQIVDQSELQINLATRSPIVLPSPIWVEFEQLQTDNVQSNLASNKASSVCANGVCTIY